MSSAQLCADNLFKMPDLVPWQHRAWLHMGCVVLWLLAESLKCKLQTAPYLPGIKMPRGPRAIIHRPFILWGSKCQVLHCQEQYLSGKHGGI